MLDDVANNEEHYSIHRNVNDETCDGVINVYLFRNDESAIVLPINKTSDNLHDLVDNRYPARTNAQLFTGPEQSDKTWRSVINLRKHETIANIVSRLARDLFVKYFDYAEDLSATLPPEIYQDLARIVKLGQLFSASDTSFNVRYKAYKHCNYLSLCMVTIEISVPGNSDHTVKIVPLKELPAKVDTTVDYIMNNQN